MASNFWLQHCKVMVTLLLHHWAVQTTLFHCTSPCCASLITGMYTSLDHARFLLMRQAFWVTGPYLWNALTSSSIWASLLTPLVCSLKSQSLAFLSRDSKAMSNSEYKYKRRHTNTTLQLQDEAESKLKTRLIPWSEAEGFSWRDRWFKPVFFGVTAKSDALWTAVELHDLFISCNF